jgi:hypothetical protein
MSFFIHGAHTWIAYSVAGRKYVFMIVGIIAFVKHPKRRLSIPKIIEALLYTI